MGKHDRIGRVGPSEPGLPGEPDDLPIIELDAEADDAPPATARVPNGTQRRRVVAVAVAAVVVAAGAVVAVTSRDHHSRRTTETIVLPAPASTTTQPIGTLEPDAEFVSAVGIVPPDGAWAIDNLELATTTADQHWRNITPPGFLNPVDSIHALAFVDARHAWLGGASLPLTIWRTTDGGRTWLTAHPDLCGPSCGTITGLDFLDARHGWLSFLDGRPGGSLAATGDGGATWRVVAHTPFTGAVHFADVRQGWAVSKVLIGAPRSGNALYHTRDGGRTWSFVPPADPVATTLAAPVFLDADTVVVASVNELGSGAEVKVWRSTNGGNSWTAFATPLALDTLRHPPSDDRFTATSASEFTLLDGEHLYVTTDAGAHWTTLTPTQTELRDVAFVTRTEGWVLADIPECGGPITGCSDQYLYRTVDGGQTWTLRSPTVGLTANRSP